MQVSAFIYSVVSQEEGYNIAYKYHDTMSNFCLISIRPKHANLKIHVTQTAFQSDYQARTNATVSKVS